MGRARFPAWRDVVGVAVALTACAGGVAATVCLHDAAPPPTLQEGEVISGSPLEQLDRLSDILGCTDEIRLSDDLYNFAPMRGSYCFMTTGDIVVARAYGAPRDLQIALQDWPLGEVDRYLVRGRTWFAVGPLAVIRVVASTVSGASEPTQILPSVTLTALEQAQESCIRLLATAAREFATNRPGFEAERADLDALYPGLPSEVEEQFQADPRVILLADPASDELRMESALSELASPLKARCATPPASRAP